MESDIRRRILQKRYPSLPKKKQAPPTKKGVIRGDFRLSKITWKGLRALYYFYIRKLREAQRQPRESIPDVLRVDLRNLDAISEQAKFLSRYQLDTGEQVETFKGKLKKQLSELQNEQKTLSNEKRRKGITPDRAAELQKQTDQLNAALRQTRKDIKLCDAVLDRSLLIEEKNRVLHEQKQQSAARVQQKTKSDRKHSR